MREPTQELELAQILSEEPLASRRNPPPQPSAGADATEQPTEHDLRERLRRLLDLVAWERMSMARIGVPLPAHDESMRFGASGPLRAQRDDAGTLEDLRRAHARLEKLAAANHRALDEAIRALGDALKEQVTT